MAAVNFLPAADIDIIAVQRSEKIDIESAVNTGRLRCYRPATVWLDSTAVLNRLRNAAYRQ